MKESKKLKKMKEVTLTDKKQIGQFWERYAKAIRPEIRAADIFQAESMGRAVTKVIR